jgi:pseudouridine kinase
MSYARNLGATAGIRIVVEPVSVPKATALAALPGMFDPSHPLYLATPNRDEVAAMTGLPADTDAELRAAADRLHENGVVLVWIRLGSRGSMLSGPDGTHVIDALPAQVTDVTGAGDSLLAGFCHALLGGADPVDAVRFGHAAASLTIASSHTVRPDLTERLVDAALNHAGSVPTRASTGRSSHPAPAPASQPAAQTLHHTKETIA